LALNGNDGGEISGFNGSNEKNGCADFAALAAVASAFRVGFCDFAGTDAGAFASIY
jgi:hypothetical protein